MTRFRQGRRPQRPPWGQHFLQDTNLRNRILKQLDPKPHDRWLEIGPGHGEITAGLAAAGSGVIAVERDSQLALALRERLGIGVRIVGADILEVSVEQLARAAGGRFRVYGSLPYYITSPILRMLFEAIEVVQDIHVVVQQEVAERLVARPGSRHYGYLTVLTQYHAMPEILFRVPRGAFRPPPQVDSALVRLQPPGLGQELRIKAKDQFLQLVSQCFRQKRKTLRNNLRIVYPNQTIEAALAGVGLNARQRAEELSIEELARLYKVLAAAGPDK